jgi:hypothetical protein
MNNENNILKARAKKNIKRIMKQYKLRPTKCGVNYRNIKRILEDHPSVKIDTLLEAERILLNYEKEFKKWEK